MRLLTVPATLVAAHLSFGCSTSVPSDASADGRTDAVSDVIRDAFQDTNDASDVSDASNDVSDGPAPVCEPGRDADGGVVCREENVQGSGLFCIRYRCGADDGGATFDDCCRLVG